MCTNKNCTIYVKRDSAGWDKLGCNMIPGTFCRIHIDYVENAPPIFFVTFDANGGNGAPCVDEDGEIEFNEGKWDLGVRPAIWVDTTVIDY